MQQWEYRVVTLRAGQYTDALNEYGRDGWELVTVASDVRGVPPPGTTGTTGTTGTGTGTTSTGGTQTTTPQSATPQSAPSPVTGGIAP